MEEMEIRDTPTDRVWLKEKRLTAVICEPDVHLHERRKNGEYIIIILDLPRFVKFLNLDMAIQF